MAAARKHSRAILAKLSGEDQPIVFSTVSNLVLTLSPNWRKPTMAAIAISDAISAYSMAVAPRPIRSDAAKNPHVPGLPCVHRTSLYPMCSQKLSNDVHGARRRTGRLPVRGAAHALWGLPARLSAPGRASPLPWDPVSLHLRRARCDRPPPPPLDCPNHRDPHVRSYVLPLSATCRW